MVRVGVWLYPWVFIRVGKMSIATGLTRLSAVFKGIGYACFAFAAIAAFVHSGFCFFPGQLSL